MRGPYESHLIDVCVVEVHATCRLEETWVIVMDAPVSGKIRPISCVPAIPHFFAMDTAVFGATSAAGACKGSTNELVDRSEVGPVVSE